MDFLSCTASSKGLLLWRKDWKRLQKSGELFQSGHSWETPASSIYKAPLQRRMPGQRWSGPEKRREYTRDTRRFKSTLSVNSLLAYLVISFLDWPITPARVLYSSPTWKIKSNTCCKTIALTRERQIEGLVHLYTWARARAVWKTLKNTLKNETQKGRNKGQKCNGRARAICVDTSSTMVLLPSSFPTASLLLSTVSANCRLIAWTVEYTQETSFGFSIITGHPLMADL